MCKFFRFTMLVVVLLNGSSVACGDEPCYVLLDAGNCVDFYGQWAANLGTSCVCNQQTQVCTQRIYADYASETAWNTNRGHWDPVMEGGYPTKTEDTFNCVTVGTCEEDCEGNEFAGFTCKKNPPPTTQPFTIEDDKLSGAPCP